MSNQLKVWLALLAGAALCYFQPLGGALLALGAFAFEYLTERQGETYATLRNRLSKLEAGLDIQNGLSNDAHRRLRDAENDILGLKVESGKDDQAKQWGLK